MVIHRNHLRLGEAQCTPNCSVAAALRDHNFIETDGILDGRRLYRVHKLQYYDPEDQSSYTPYVVETSIGLDRMFLAILSKAYVEEKLEDDSERIVLRIPNVIAPVKVSVLPLVPIPFVDA